MLDSINSVGTQANAYRKFRHGQCHLRWCWVRYFVWTTATICKEPEITVWQKQLFSDLTSQVVPAIDMSHIVISAIEIYVKSLAAEIITINTLRRSVHPISKTDFDALSLPLLGRYKLQDKLIYRKHSIDFERLPNLAF